MSEQEAEARRLTIEHDLEWLRRVERRMEGVPVTEDFGTLYFTCAAKLETRLRQLAKAEQELGDLRHNARILEEAREHESRRAFKAEQERDDWKREAYHNATTSAAALKRERELGLKYDQLKSEFLSYKELTEIEIDGYREQIQKLQDK